MPLASWGRVVWQEGDGVVMFFLPCSGFLCHIMGLPLFCDVRYEKVKTQAKSTMFQNPWGIQVSAKLARTATLRFLGPKQHLAGSKTCKPVLSSECPPLTIRTT